MRVIHALLTLAIALGLCLGAGPALAAQTGQTGEAKQEQPAEQSQEEAKTKTEKPKVQQDDKQPQPANVPVIKQDEGC